MPEICLLKTFLFTKNSWTTANVSIKRRKLKFSIGLSRLNKLLLDRGFNATYIETEDIHLNRRHQEAIQEKRLKEWAQAKNYSEK